MRKIKRIVIHCTGTESTATLGSIQRHWRQKLGWKSPGYHYIVAADGTLIQLASDDRITNGVRGYNPDSLHVAYIGGVIITGQKKRNDDTRTEAQKRTLLNLLTELHRRYPRAFIMGHRDLSPDKNGNGIVDPWERIKDCPCFDAIPEYEHIRTMNNKQ